ncbi:phage baseplate protein [Fusobacterium necrophorum]|uniref:phage baseplate protein n=1 Tax=Fusobacterium necrophorum TaxID=859 RepID=UPI000A5C0E32|nr:hypothetical protein [Fusobacterium necrophorum]
MSYFKHLKLSRKGEQLQAKINGNLSETLTFTKAELGGGNIESEEEIRFLTSLKEKWGDAVISKCELQGEEKTMVSLELQFTNAELQENKVFRELGLYARGNDGEEVLYAYANAGENYDYIPLMKDSPHSFIITIYFTVSSGTKIDANIDLSGYVSLQTFKEKIKEIEKNLKEKEPKFEKKSGFNLEKTDDYKKNDSSFLLDTVGSNKLYKEIQKKEPKFEKKSGFNLEKTDDYKKDSSYFLLDTVGSKQLYEDLLAVINSLDKCPYRIGDIYITTNSQNPALIWIGTTWEKIEGRFLRATANGESARITGGSDSKVLSIDNMPSHNHELTIYENGSHTHTQSAHSHNRGNMEISGHFEGNRDGAKASGAFKHDGSWNYGSGDGGAAAGINFNASKAWSGNTSTAQPAITSAGNHTHNHRLYYTGGGKSFDIKPAYMTAHQWIRRS